MADLTPQQVDELAADISPAGFRAHSNKTVPQFVDFLKKSGLSDDEVEATFIKNFGTPTYNADPTTAIKDLRSFAPEQIRKRGVAKAKGYEEIFFSPEEKAGAPVEQRPTYPTTPYVPAVQPTAQPEAPVATLPSEATQTQGVPALVPAEEGASISAGQGAFPEEPWYTKAGRALLPHRAEVALLGEPPYSREQYEKDLQQFKSGPVPEFSLKQVGRPLGFVAGASSELAKLGIAGGAAVTAGLTGQSTKDVLREAEKGIGAEAGYLTPATAKNMQAFAQDVEAKLPKAFVDNAAAEGADVIGGLATMLFRDIVPVLPGQEKDFYDYLKTGFESGEGFTAGFPVMATFGLSVAKEALTGNFEQAAKMAAAKPVTLALILLPYIKKGVINVTPKARAWVERTAGKYYAEQTPDTRAGQEVGAAARRYYTDPMAQATPAETEQMSAAFQQAKAAAGATEEALRTAAKEVPDRTAYSGREFLPVETEPSTRQGKGGQIPLGVTEPEVRSAVQQGTAAVPQEAQMGVRTTLGIQGEKAAFETGTEAPTGQQVDVLTRQEKPAIQYEYDPRNKSVSKQVLTDVSEDPYGTGTGADIYSQKVELEEIARDVERTATRPAAIQRYRTMSGDMTSPDDVVVNNIRTASRLSSARGKGFLVETSMIPPTIENALTSIRTKLLERLRYDNRIPETTNTAKLAVDVADQISAVAADVLAENETVFFRDPNLRKALVKPIIQELKNSGATYIPKEVEVLKVLDNIAQDATFRIPRATLVFGDTVIEADGLESIIHKTYNSIIDNNPKARFAIIENIRQQVTPRLEEFAFNQSLAQSAVDMTLNVAKTPQAVENIVNAVRDNLSANRPQPAVLVIEDPRAFTEAVKDLQDANNPAFKAVGDQFARYEDANPELVRLGIVPKGAKVSRGFNESVGSIAKGVQQFKMGDKIFGAYKANLTSRNIVSAINNLASNILLETLYYGDPSVIMDIVTPKSQLRQFVTRFKENAPASIEEAEVMKAIREAKIIDTSLLDTELDMTSGGNVGKGFFNKLNNLQDRFYKWGDSFFKMRTVLIEMQKAQDLLRALPEKGTITINNGLGGLTEIMKVGEDMYGIVDKKTGQVSILNPQEVNGVLARGAARIAGEKYVNYDQRPLYLNKLEQLRYGPFGGPLITPFLTWSYKMADTAMPYVSTGEVATGAMKGLPKTVRVVPHAGVGSAFSDSVVVDSNSMKVKALISGDAFMEGARRAAIFGAAENIGGGQEEMVRKGLSFSGKPDPALVYLNSQDPRVVYGKNLSQLNFFNPSLTALKGLNDVVIPAIGYGMGLLTGKDSDYFMPKSYLDRRAKGQTFEAKDFLELAGYGGDSLYDFYKKIDEARDMGALDAAYEGIKAVMPAVIGGTYSRILSTGIDKLIGNNRKAGKYPTDPREVAPVFEEAMRQILGIGFKESYLYGNLKGQKPTEVLDKVYQDYSASLYKNLEQKFVQEFTAAKEAGATEEQLNMIRTKHQANLDAFKRISREIADNYRDIVNKAKASKK